jgi:1,4-dihydroxy-2-naphthoate octaprenyltransferase
MADSSLAPLSPPRGTVWIQALRLYSLSASIIPVALGVALAWPQRDRAGELLWLPALVGAVLLHLGTNLLNDVGDFESGVDRLGVSEGSGVLTRGLLAPGQLSRTAYLLFALGALCGLPVAILRGWPLVALGAVGLLGGWGYTAGPRYKYLGLGDVCVFALMGPLMALGGALAVAGRLEPQVALAAIPVGLLVVAILHANNLRDLEADAEAGIHTIARGLGLRGSLLYFALLLFGAEVSLVILWRSGLLPIGALAGLITLPIGLKLLRVAARAASPAARRAANLVEETAKLHLLFGLLVVVGTVASRLFH